jgi:hypothetical protein
MLLVYVAGDFATNSDNWKEEQDCRLLEDVSKQILDAGMLPIAPVILYRKFIGATLEGFWEDSIMTLVKKSHAVFILPNWCSAPCRKDEESIAEEYGIPVFRDLQKLRTWAKNVEFSEYLPFSSGSFMLHTSLSVAKDLAEMGSDMCSQLAKYLETGKPEVVRKENAGRFFDFLLTFGRHEFDVLAERLRDAYLVKS